LLEEGYEVDVAAPSAKKLQFVVHDFVDGFDTYTEKPGHTWPADVAFSDVNPADYPSASSRTTGPARRILAERPRR
jgi:protease I